MTDLDILRQMIKDSARIELVDSYDKKKVELAESQQTNSSVTVLGLPDDTIVIKADAFASPKSVFNDLQGECKRADFIIVTSDGDRKTIICIEMKVGKGETEAEIIKQLKGAKCFIVYCREIGRSFWGAPSFLDDYTYRFVSIRESSIAKRRTRPDLQTGVHDQPDKMLKLLGKGSFQYNRLVGSSR